jgi:hypothetical protein
VNINPKKDFNEGPHKKKFHDASAENWLHAAVNTALLQMQLSLPHPADMGTSASYQWRMEGAKQFIGILMNLTEPKPERPERPEQNLKHDA